MRMLRPYARPNTNAAPPRTPHYTYAPTMGGARPVFPRTCPVKNRPRRWASPHPAADFNRRHGRGRSELTLTPEPFSPVLCPPRRMCKIAGDCRSKAPPIIRTPGRPLRVQNRRTRTSGAFDQAPPEYGIAIARMLRSILNVPGTLQYALWPLLIAADAPESGIVLEVAGKHGLNVPVAKDANVARLGIARLRE